VVVPRTTDTISTVGGAGTPPTRLLVLGMAHRDGSIIASELYSVLEPCGLTVDQVRSQMRRLVAEGLFERDGEGRDATYRATPAGAAALAAVTTRHTLAYAQDAAGRGWDRMWRIVAFAIPESRRADRDAFRDTLLRLGAAPLQNGVYVSPHRWEKEVQGEIERHDIAQYVNLATTEDLSVGGVTDPRRIAATLWPLDDIARRYQEFIEAYRGVPEMLERMRRSGRRISEEEWLPGALLIAIRFNQSFEIDPLLPPELLPRPWPGREARQLLAACRKLGILTREDKSGPALFSVFDDAISNLP
jgi:phenylacetic acid degradation operon negative regulatory protein